MSKSKILQNLVAARMKEEHLSLRQAGNQVGVVHTTIQRVLDNESINLPTVEKVCDWLGVPVSAVVDTVSQELEMAIEISTLFSTNIEFAEVFSNLAQKIQSSAINPTIFSEITAFLAFSI